MADKFAPQSGLCTCFRMRKLARLMTQRYDRELAAAGINVNQYSILRRASNKSRAIGELSRELGMDRTTLTRDLKPLIASGWIELIPGVDARQRFVKVTTAGKRVAAKAQPLWLEAQKGVEAVLGSTKLAALHAQLDRTMVQLRAPTA